MAKDIAIINVPCVLLKAPLVAPALLKGSLVSAGFTVKTIDFNIKFFNELKDHPNFLDFQTYFLEGVIADSKKEQLDEYINCWVDSILAVNPKWVGISVFTYQCRIATTRFCQLIKQKNSEIKIVLGGQGLSQGGINGDNTYPSELKQQGLIDFYIKSEGEVSIVELLRGNTGYAGINSNTFNQVDNLDELAYPNFDDYDFSAYEFKRLPITGSRGCIRKCNFCDIHQHWKYKYRTGSDIVKEMKHLSEQYNIKEFVFTDSLVNGNGKEFTSFLNALSDYNLTTTEKISWSGQYIVKSKKVDNTKHWQLMKESGCNEIWVGVESASEKVRREMNKFFTDDDLYNTIEQSSQHGIGMRLLMLVGYPTETIDDFNKTLELLNRYSYLANSSIRQVTISDTVSILPGTPLYNTANENNILIDEKHENNWLNLDYPELDLKERIRRVREAKKLVEKLGYNNSFKETHDLLNFLDSMVDTYEKRIKVKKMVWLKK